MDDRGQVSPSSGGRKERRSGNLRTIFRNQWGTGKLAKGADW